MQILIDIDEEIYKSIKIGMRNRDDMAEIGEAVENGIPLDKLRAALHATAEMHEDGDYYLRDEWIDEYFDKYRAESER